MTRVTYSTRTSNNVMNNRCINACEKLKDTLQKAVDCVDSLLIMEPSALSSYMHTQLRNAEGSLQRVERLIKVLRNLPEASNE